MSRFLEYSPDQAYLLPPSVKGELGADHLSFFLHQVVERLDLSEFEQAYSEEGGALYAPALRTSQGGGGIHAGGNRLQRDAPVRSKPAPVNRSIVKHGTGSTTRDESHGDENQVLTHTLQGCSKGGWSTQKTTLYRQFRRRPCIANAQFFRCLSRLATPLESSRGS